VVTDHGATRELAESLTEGVRRHLDDLARRLPEAALVLQVDEPSLPAVLAGEVPTASGWGSVRSVESSVVEQTLSGLLSVAQTSVVHCCAPAAPLRLFGDAGADALAVDGTTLTAADLDALGEAIDGGLAVLLGVVPGMDTSITVAGVVERVERLWQTLGFARSQLPESLVLTSACGLAGASPAYARRVMSVLRDAAAKLAEESA
jgi:methionine synthase II (cobalamin-independent)